MTPLDKNIRLNTPLDTQIRRGLQLILPNPRTSEKQDRAIFIVRAVQELASGCGHTASADMTRT
ncbi:cell polarity protein [Moniliophthora roreri]|nr:cell polarity protein [Moniliophthora roreri]